MREKRRLARFTARIGLGLVLLAVCVMVLGGLYGLYVERKLTAGYDPPGQLVDIGSHRLHLYCTGMGGPPVVLLSGSGLTYVAWSWERIQASLAESTRVCSYDRAGLGWSDHAHVSPSANQAVQDLVALLSRSGIEGPWIVVGHSLGGLHAQQMMNLHPELVAGLVLVEPTPDDMFRQAPGELTQFERGALEALFDAVSLMRPVVGLQRFWGDLKLRISGYVPEDDPWWLDKQLYLTAKHRRTAAAEWGAIPESCEQVLAARVPWGDLPLDLLVGESTWASAEEADIVWAEGLVMRSSRGRREVVEGAGHGIPWERADAVVTAVDSMIRVLRAGS